MSANNRNDILNRLVEGIKQLTSSDKWCDWLAMQSRFHSYSFNNTLLILTQRPDASRIAGFNAWRKLDRFVLRGEKAIWILAPMIYRVEGQDSSDEGDRVLRGFKPVAVFDVAQTDGRDLPEVCTRLVGDDEAGAYEKLLAVGNLLGFTVHDADDLEGANGDCSHDLRRIWVLSTNTPRQRVKTLAHELAHAILHAPDETSTQNRALKELEAESVAFIVCTNLDVTSDDYSFGYVATWSGGGDEACRAIKESGARIQRAADQILSAVVASPAVAQASCATMHVAGM